MSTITLSVRGYKDRSLLQQAPLPIHRTLPERTVKGCIRTANGQWLQITRHLYEGVSWEWAFDSGLIAENIEDVLKHINTNMQFYSTLCDHASSVWFRIVTNVYDEQSAFDLSAQNMNILCRINAGLEFISYITPPDRLDNCHRHGDISDDV